MEPTAERDPGTEAGWAVIDAGVRRARRALGDGLVSAYAIGSLAHGGFSAAASDVDLALLTDGATVPVEQIRGEVERDLPGLLSRRLSIFHVAWADFASPPPESRFPAIDRLDLMRAGTLVSGEDLRGRFGVEPEAGEVVEQAVSAALARHDPDGLRAEIAAIVPDTIESRGASKLVLWPVRLLHAVETGDPAGNDEAVVHYRESTQPPRQLELVEAALSWREAEAVPDAEKAVAALRSELMPLHSEVYARLAGIDDLPHAKQIASRAADYGETRRA